MRILRLAIGLWAAAGLAAGRTAEKAVLLLQPAAQAPAAFQQFGIRSFVYTPEGLSKTVGTEFEDDLAHCRVLMVARGGNEAAAAAFAVPACQAAIRDFLAEGGTLFFDYNTYPAAAALARVLAFSAPGNCEPQTHRNHRGLLTEAGRRTLGSADAPAAARTPGGYGGWIAVPPPLEVLARMEGEPQAAVLLEQRSVQGGGRVVFSQLAGLMSDPDPFFQRFWSWLLGEDIQAAGPGIPLEAADPPPPADPPVNPLYLCRAGEPAWEDPAFDRRLPILMAEPAGLARRAAPVSLVLPAAAGGLRLLTHAGEPVPFQRVEQPGGQMEVVFQTDLQPLEHRLFHLYAGGPDPAAEPQPAGIPELVLAEGGRRLGLANAALVAELFTNSPGIASLRLRSGGRGDAVSGWRSIDSGGALLVAERSAWDPPVVAERGPVRLSISQTSADGALEVLHTLYAGDVPWLVQTVRSGTPAALHLPSRWSPGGRSDECSFVYPAEDGVRAVQGGLSAGAPLQLELGDLRPFLAEGWIAVQEGGGEAVGTCFAHDALQALEACRKAHLGASVELRFAKRTRHRTLAILSRKGWEDVRRASLAFQAPPAVLLGVWQPREQREAPQPPRPGQDLHRLLYFRTRWMKPALNTADPAAARDLARREVRAALRWGANVIRPELRGGASDGDYAFWEELVRLGTANGLAIYGFPPPEEPLPPAVRASLDLAPHPCPVQDRESWYLRTFGGGAAEAARRGGGALVHVMDEYSWFHTNRSVQALFRERYGGDLPLPGTPGRPSERAYADALLFRTEIITELARDVSREIRRHLPGCAITSVVNLKGLERANRLSDMEEHSRHLDLPGVDLYSALAYYRRLLLFARGAFGNAKRVENCVGYAEGRELLRQLEASTFHGASLHFFGGSDTAQIAPQRMTDVVGPYYNWLRFTGMHRLLGGMRPVPHAALLRDRRLLFETIRNLELPADESTFTVERGLYALADLNNLQTDMLFSRFLTLEALRPYRLLMVPDNKYLSEDFAATIGDYVRGGGCAYVEGASTSANAQMRKLCREGVPAAQVGGCTLLRRALGQGTLLYTEAFLSERLRSDLQARTELKALFAGIAGPGPVSLRSPAEPDIDHLLHSDGGRHLLALANHSPFATAEVECTLHLPVSAPALRIDLKTGRRERYDGPFTTTLAPETTQFFLLTPEAAFSWPAATNAPQDASCYSFTPGPARRPRPKAPGRPASAARRHGPLRVGVFVHPAMRQAGPGDLKGQLGVAAALEQDHPGLSALRIADLTPDTLAPCDVVVVPNTRKAPPPAGWERALRAFVEAGGGALLIHHAVGYGSGGAAMFPEIGRGVDFVPQQEWTPTADHPLISGDGLEHRVSGMKPEAVLRSGFPDFISLSPGPSGTVLGASLRGRTPRSEPLLVAGDFGAGRVVLCGVNLGCQAEPGGVFRAEVSRNGEHALLLNAVRWLGRSSSGTGSAIGDVGDGVSPFGDGVSP